MMKLTKREKILLLLLFVVGGGYMYYRFVFVPETETITRLRGEYQQKTAILEKVKDKDYKLRELKQQIADMEKQKSSLGKGVIQPIRVPDLLSELEQACVRNGITADHISFSGGSSAVKGQLLQQDTGSGPKSLQDAAKTLSGLSSESNSSSSKPSSSPNQGELPGSVTMSFTFAASYESLMNLVKYYEGNTRLFLLDSLEVKGDAAGKCTGKISFTTYTLLRDTEDFRYNTDTSSQRQSPFK